MSSKREYLVSGKPLMPPVHPGEILKEDVFPALDLSVTEAARHLGVSRQSLHRIMAGQQPVTVEMSLRIGKFCGNRPEIWLRMQQAYDLWFAELRLKSEIERIPSYG